MIQNIETCCKQASMFRFLFEQRVLAEKPKRTMTRTVPGWKGEKRENS